MDEEPENQASPKESGNQADIEERCSKEWDVIVSNISDEIKSLSVKITHNGGSVIYSETLELETREDTFAGVEIDAEVTYGKQYTFEAGLSEENRLSTKEEISCGNVYIFITGSNELEIRIEDNRGDI